MDLDAFVNDVRRDLTTMAGAADAESRAAVDRVLAALEPALRLAALDLLSQAADEVTAALPGGSVDVRLRGREPELVVAAPQPTRHQPSLLADEDADELDDPMVRVTLRIPESLKGRAEEQATSHGLSLNAWIVSVLRAATSRRAVSVDVDLSSIPLETTPRSGFPPARRTSAGKR